MSLINPEHPIVVTSVAFADGSLEIGYLEKREQTDNVGMMRTLFVDTQRTKLSSQYNELQELLLDIVENALLALRNPEKSLDPRKRILRRPVDAVETEEDEDDDIA